MTIFQSVVLGMVQGLTEFLPVSSSAHLILFPWLFGWKDPGLAFDAFLHFGTLLAVLLYFASDWLAILKAGVVSIIDRRIGFDRDRLLFWLIGVGTVPAVLAGLLFHEQVETIFREPVLIAVPLAFVGFLLYWVDGNYPSLRRIEELTFKDAIWIGIAQAFAIIPGVSRSGGTMAMARLLGVNREAAARFSFLLSLPIILGACAFEWKKLAAQTADAFSVNSLLWGLGSATLFGMVAIHLLLHLVKTADFRFFAWYRVLLAALIIVLSIFPLR